MDLCYLTQGYNFTTAAGYDFHILVGDVVSDLMHHVVMDVQADKGIANTAGFKTRLNSKKHKQYFVVHLHNVVGRDQAEDVEKAGQCRTRETRPLGYGNGGNDCSIPGHGGGPRMDPHGVYEVYWVLSDDAFIRKATN